MKEGLHLDKSCDLPTNNSILTVSLRCKASLRLNYLAEAASRMLCWIEILVVEFNLLD